MAPIDPALTAWVVAGVSAGVIAIGMVAAAAVRQHRQRRCDARAAEVRRLLVAALVSGSDADAVSCRVAMLARPDAAVAVLARMAWLLRGAWLARLRRILADDACADALLRLARRPQRPAGGLALQLLGTAGRGRDELARLAAGGDATAAAAAVGLLRGWPLDDPAVAAALRGLEERRPDLLAALLPQLDRQAVAAWMAAITPSSPDLPGALFAAARLDLAAAPELIAAGCDDDRSQVRRSACLAVRAPGHRACLPAIRRLAGEDPEALVRAAALAALARLPEPGNLPVLAEVLRSAPWIVQARAVAVVLAHGEAGTRLLRSTRQQRAWRSGAVRWIRELAPEAAP